MKRPASMLQTSKRLPVLIVVVLATVLVVRAWEAWRGPPLHAWHAFEPHGSTGCNGKGATASAAISRAAWKR
ncbi:hypothetical protein [Rhodanobacter sp. PCA2]|uniref:hypothetical protein n=1 Tax=Rhodanobacter sp. PCA2 TaxID=2006117 RepID=UPI0015E64641|nr:hypothetical protein [Rhodanobacter sp. PCA2]